MKKFLDLLTLPAKCLVSLLEKYDMEANKIAASIFVAGIIAMFSGLIASGIYSDDHRQGEEKRGYVVPGAEAFEVGASGSAETAEQTGPVDIATFLATADITAGEKLLKKCTACHTFDKGGKHGVGPNNYGIVGAPIAHVSEFSYSDAIMAKKGEKWTFEELSHFLENPKKYAPGNKMAFAGIRKPQDRANLLAYLNTLSASPLPYPAPKPIEKPAEKAADEQPAQSAEKPQ